MAYTMTMDGALKALAEPRRREILRLVWSVEMPASQIAARFEDITRSAVSQHLGVLRGAHLVIERRDGTRRLYRANHNEMAKLRSFLDDFWAESLDRLRDLAEASEESLQGTVPRRLLRQTENDGRQTTNEIREKGRSDG
jgi:DNA-binding transcriptional ArsR family regulator